MEHGPVFRGARIVPSRLRAETAPRWAELALACGFYDQSHLVNEFQALCGLSPTQYWQSAVSGSSKTPA